MFDKMPKKNMVTWTTFINDGYLELGLDNEALIFLILTILFMCVVGDQILNLGVKFMLVL